MRVILDTNVLLASLISPHCAPDAIYRGWRAAHFELVTSQAQLDELRRVSRYPKLKAILPAHRVGTMINNLHRAVVLVTGDKRAGLLQRGNIGRARIVTPTGFCAEVLK